MTEQENEHDDEPRQEKNYGQYRPGLVDHGHNQITVGDDDPLLKRLLAKHGDRRY